MPRNFKQPGYNVELVKLAAADRQRNIARYRQIIGTAISLIAGVDVKRLRFCAKLLATK